MPVSQPSFGSLISGGFEYIFSGSWWITVIPGMVLVLVLNLLGDWLRDVLKRLNFQTQLSNESFSPN